MKEYYYDKLLNIKTVGEQKGFNESLHYHRYEPTPYSALEHLFNQYEMKSGDHVVDFGCGKGRLNFFINYMFRASVVGIELNETYYLDAIQNRKNYLKRYGKNYDKIEFLCCPAEEYEISDFDNRFYFFNPFSVQIFMKIINHILRSFEKEMREIELVLYYPSNDYIYFLENQTAFELKQEVQLPGLYKENPNERFLIYVIKVLDFTKRK
ncbi:SAM-dependent methyltransferase [Bacillus sp. PS06]|uniref:SAM-dependent methyltransferase n=1 Tax=Bacillus sp. PS06 TaxID=2764176 RepID=UPI0017863815|nr:class I SAM-dependent methyltransferase [Bacillus sp. PS06]MBD8070898.1 class I SAM-dependent methyltransferase [Bacillus sp. PS06]